MMDAGKSVEKRQDPSALRQARDGKSGNDLSVPVAFSEAEAKANRGIDRVAMEEAVRQAAIDLREHEPGVGIKLLRKLPIDGERNGVERPMAVCERRGVGAVDGCTKGGLVVMIISANHVQIVSDGVFHSSPEYMEQLVAGAESRVVNVRVVDRSAAGADEVSRDITKTSPGGKRIAGGRILNEFVSGKQLERAVAVFANQHHARIIGERSGENLRQHRRQRVAGKRDPHAVLDEAANRIERKRSAGQIGNVAAELELVGTSRGVVQLIAAELPERRNPELANVNAIFCRGAESAVLGVAYAAGDSLPADRREGVRSAHWIVGKNSGQSPRVLPENRQGAIG